MEYINLSDFCGTGMTRVANCRQNGKILEFRDVYALRMLFFLNDNFFCVCLTIIHLFGPLFGNK